MGVPHEFKAPVQIAVSMVMPPEYQKTWRRVPYGTWSDDGSLTLAMAASLTERGVDVEDFGKKLLSWYNKAEFTPDKHMFDIGNTTQEAILKIARGHSAKVSGLSNESSNGNGSLMRTLPIALYSKGDNAQLFREARELSAVTHAHDFSINACGIYAVTARELLQGSDPTRALIVALRASPKTLPIPKEPGGSGFVLDSLSFAIKALRNGWSYEHTVRQAIALGGDTDTTAAIGGGLVALREGVSSIPADWLAQLRGKDVASSIIEPFVEACG